MGPRPRFVKNDDGSRREVVLRLAFLLRADAVVFSVPLSRRGVIYKRNAR